MNKKENEPVPPQEGDDKDFASRMLARQRAALSTPKGEAFAQLAAFLSIKHKVECESCILDSREAGDAEYLEWLTEHARLVGLDSRPSGGVLILVGRIEEPGYELYEWDAATSKQFRDSGKAGTSFGDFSEELIQ